LALIGWNPGTEQEIFSIEEIIAEFEIDRIQKGGGAFNEEKLLWMNKEYLQKLSDEDFFAYSLNALPERVKQLPLFSNETLSRLLPVIKERVHVQTQITQAAEAKEYDFAFSVPDVAKETITWKNDTSPTDALPRLQKAIELLENADFSSAESIKSAVWPYAEEVGKGELLWPLRVSITGMERSPDPFISAYIIGKEQTILRIKNACAKIEA
jgi:glutamyl/glutaminyl-tRNA synthetase